MEVEDDDWDLTAEELDSLERDAFQKIAQLRDSSTPPSQQFNLQQHHFLKPPSANHSQPFPPNPISDSHPQRVDALPQGARALPPPPPLSLKPGTKKDEPSKELPKFFVKLFLHSSGHVAAKFQYDQAMFHGRLWMFPLSSLSEAEKVLGEISNYKVQIYTNSADAKIPAVLEYLGTVIEAGCKFLIFAHDQPMINAIHECLLVHPVCIKATIGYRFPGKGSYISRRLCYPLKLGSWINFNCCKHSYLCFVEQSWTPGDLIQVENRAHRIDQHVLSVDMIHDRAQWRRLIHVADLT
ncbi:SWI/SNF-related matrix-associated actin-dependent regulator of chromatin subfamily A-like protein [Arachis hypogaea]|nr:SWI/SNF-related matrix-associated actin-dependent regulator of chromatin subfamily A-like protein [Arachis hypogaea]